MNFFTFLSVSLQKFQTAVKISFRAVRIINFTTPYINVEMWSFS